MKEYNQIIIQLTRISKEVWSEIKTVIITMGRFRDLVPSLTIFLDFEFHLVVYIQSVV